MTELFEVAAIRFTLLQLQQQSSLTTRPGGGKQGLSNTLLSLNLIAFAFHGVCDQLCALWKIAHNQCFRRKPFFAAMDLLTEYI